MTGIGLSALEGLGELEEERFGVGGADELETCGKIFWSETGGDGDGGKAGEVGGTIGAKEKGASGVVFVVEANGFLVYLRSCDGSGGNGEGVYAGVLQGLVELQDEFFAELQGGEIGCGADFGSHFEAGAYVFAVVGGAGGEPAGLLVIESGFGPGDLIASVFGFVEQRKRDFFEAHALFFQEADGFVKDGLHFGRNDIQKKFFGDAESKFAGFGRGFF